MLSLMAVGDDLSFSLLASGDGQQSLVFLGSVDTLVHLSLCGPYLLPVCLHIVFPLCYVCTQISLFYKDTSHIELELILTWLNVQRSYFQVRSCSEVLKVRTSTYISGGHAVTHDTQSRILGFWYHKLFSVSYGRLLSSGVRHFYFLQRASMSHC